MPGYPCCCDKPCECLCEDCVDGFAPCCWTVVINGFNSCVACQTLDKTYFLPQADDGSSATAEGCSWISGEVCGPPDITEILLTVFQEGGDYIIEVTLGDHVWSKNYGTSKPNCCALTNESLPNTATAGDCDVASVTCKISARSDALSCQTPSCSNAPCNCICDKFCAEAAPCCIGVTVSGLTNGSCGDCGDLNTTYILSQTADGACTYSDDISPAICGISVIEAEAYLDGVDYKIKVTLGDHTWEHNFGTSKPDCTTFMDETYSRTGSNTVCGGSSAIISLSNVCPPLDGCVCDNWPFEWAVDVGSTGWADFTCGFCDQIRGIFVVPSRKSGSICSGLLDIDISSGEDCDSSPPDSKFNIDVLGNGFEWTVRLDLGQGPRLIEAIYKGTFGVYGLDCFDKADEDGKYTLTKVHELVVTTPMCTVVGSFLDPPAPDTIQIWDANA